MPDERVKCKRHRTDAVAERDRNLSPVSGDLSTRSVHLNAPALAHKGPRGEQRFCNRHHPETATSIEGVLADADGHHGIDLAKVLDHFA